ncbi:RcnB family protein [Sphingobium vermicomposti]|uniref:ATP-dependent RNA helicase n=1 Tax=Sphingobium vermicomposti TaxID=529005 RepID=A0A846M9Q3_9SPHN|nr:RcnB family protein [Sphingobium vermicomposti]NIJ17491.1 hypothetical protein [Sphingobium vermicomposti]
MLKKIMLLGLMSATILGGTAPAYAQRGDDSGWRGRSERPAARADSGRQGGEARQQRQGQRAQQQRRDDRPAARVVQPRPQARWQGEARRPNNIGTERREGWRVMRSSQDGPRALQENRRETRDNRREDRRVDRRDDRRGNERWNNDDRRWRGNAAVGRRFDDRTRWSSQRRWNNDWRQDRRYDWRSYRSHYSDRYRVGRYHAPRGWSYGYNRYSIGIVLNSLLFSNSYWINDPWSYRLPPAYGTLRWVRYYDDALLVDIRDGYVVDVIHDFFW